MTEIDELDELKEFAEEQANKKSRIEGKIEAVKESMSDEGYKSILEAKKFVYKKKMSIKKNKELLNKKLKSLKVKYADQLQEIY